MKIKLCTSVIIGLFGNVSIFEVMKNSTILERYRSNKSGRSCLSASIDLDPSQLEREREGERKNIVRVRERECVGVKEVV